MPLNGITFSFYYFFWHIVQTKADANRWSASVQSDVTATWGADFTKFMHSHYRACNWLNRKTKSEMMQMNRWRNVAKIVVVTCHILSVKEKEENLNYHFAHHLIKAVTAEPSMLLANSSALNVAGGGR